MIAVVIIPAVVWLILLVLLWIALYLTIKPLCIEFPRAATWLKWSGLAKVFFACLAAFATSHYSIGRLACYSGIFGLPISLCVFIAEAILLLILIKKSNWSFGLSGQSACTILTLWFALALFSFLAHTRSALLCTV